ncbi:DUF6844 domain-containing protein [Marinobacterium weihaiense]|uniref:DUF6844 domain-containing protein n=1 Tax=Marinobacterium weihaiense TaxID=2851016 RepID=A0ABS6MDL9_9GAMM|nr:hypothetical protein [Marinobacterium weihaiense]MBV0934411.1 hypothetical protein [Marinobacterium weihaiense]
MTTLFKKTALALALGSLAPGVQAQDGTAAPVGDHQAIATTAVAQAPVQAEAVEIAMADAAEPAPLDPGMMLMEQIEEWKYNAGAALSERADNGEIFMTEGTAFVKVTPDATDWADHRLMAYKEALMNAQAQFIEFEGISTRAETVNKFFEDKSQMPRFSPQELQSSNKLEEVLNKAVALAGGKLDKQLSELGIDPDEFNAAPPEKRARLFENSISEQVSTRARASLTGLIPVKTFEANDAQGRHAIAVIVVASDKMRQFVYDMKQSKGDMAPNPKKVGGPSLRERFSSNKAALIHEFGIRKMFDENGYPVLVSFGQAGTGYNGTDFNRQMNARKGAFMYAKADAYANFAYLLNSVGNAELSSSRKSMNVTDGVVRTEQDGVMESEETRIEMVKAINNEISARGSISDLPGTRQLMRWTAKHPQHGNEINGVVYVWHPVSEQNARDMRDFRPKRTEQAQTRERNGSNGNAGATQSRDLMSADDF